MSQVKVSSIVDTSGGNTATINGYTPTLSNMAGRNRIINGDMRIDQRNNGASVSASGTASGYSVDRFQYFVSGGGAYTLQRSSVAPTGFTNSLLITVTTADASIAAGDYYWVQQQIEGFNTADLGFGTANATAVTVSFWVRSSLTGTFSGGLENQGTGGNRGYAFTFTINAANTWEYKSITIVGDTTGTWMTDNSTGISLTFNLGTGSDRLAAAGSWVSGRAIGATGSTNLIATNGATFYITGVQLEAGSVATPFERRPYGTELALCQRYATVYGGNTVYEPVGFGFGNTTTSADVCVALPVQMRAVPSLTVSGNFQVSDGTNNFVVTTFSILGSQSGTQQIQLRGSVASGLTQFRPYRIETNNNTTARAILSAEL